MVSLIERHSLLKEIEVDKELYSLYTFIFRKNDVSSHTIKSAYADILKTIRDGNSTSFKNELTKLSGRRITQESTWLHDDALLFLTLLGCHMFAANLELLTPILDAREKNQTPEARKINQVFRSLSRSEFSYEGEYAFIKIPFLQILEKFKISQEDSIRFFDYLNFPGKLNELSYSPFLKLLAVRAYDIILLERTPSKIESLPSLIEGIEKYARQFTLRQTFTILASLPILFYVFLAPIVASIFTAGMKCHSLWEVKENITRPTALVLTPDVQTPLPSSFAALSNSLISLQSAAKDQVCSLLSAQAVGVNQPTAKFTLEISHPRYPIKSGFILLTERTDGGRSYTLIPVRLDGAVLRAYVPQKTQFDTILVFVVVQHSKNDAVPTSSELFSRVLE